MYVAVAFCQEILACRDIIPHDSGAKTAAPESPKTTEGSHDGDPRIVAGI